MRQPVPGARQELAGPPSGSCGGKTGDTLGNAESEQTFREAAPSLVTPMPFPSSCARSSVSQLLPSSVLSKHMGPTIS